ncbi:MAG: CARDB domain-containing protein [Thermoleophilia bacterium]|nr:CARDB domain-containing protein [Thermoleophilia bacterium]
MSFFEDDEERIEEIEEVTETGRRPGRRKPKARKPKERKPKERKPRGGGPPLGQSPLARVLIILAAVVILVLITSLGIQSCLNKKKVGEYRDYFNSVEAVVKESDEIGKQLSDMLMNPDEAVRQSLEAKLAEFLAAQEQLLEKAKQIKPPDQFKQENEWFVATMQIRVRGLKGLQPAMLNALEARDNQAGAAQVSHELLILLAGDVAYDEFYYQPCQLDLKEENITDIKVPQAKFLKDPALASPQTAVTVLDRLKGGTAQVSGLHGVSLVGVKAKPSGMVLVSDSENSLKASESLTFEVEVENQGEATESEVPISLNLSAPGRPSPQKVDGTIPTIAPGERRTIELTGLAAEAGSQAALLRAEVGPVAGEANTQNNVGEFSIVFS